MSTQNLLTRHRRGQVAYTTENSSGVTAKGLPWTECLVCYFGDNKLGESINGQYCEYDDSKGYSEKGLIISPEYCEKYKYLVSAKLKEDGEDTDICYLPYRNLNECVYRAHNKNNNYIECPDGFRLIQINVKNAKLAAARPRIDWINAKRKQRKLKVEAAKTDGTKYARDYIFYKTAYANSQCSESTTQKLLDSSKATYEHKLIQEKACIKSRTIAKTNQDTAQNQLKQVEKRLTENLALSRSYEEKIALIKKAMEELKSTSTSNKAKEADFSAKAKSDYENFKNLIGTLRILTPEQGALINEGQKEVDELDSQGATTALNKILPVSN